MGIMAMMLEDVRLHGGASCETHAWRTRLSLRAQSVLRCACTLRSTDVGRVDKREALGDVHS
jgi:hypothetical protein